MKPDRFAGLHLQLDLYQAARWQVGAGDVDGSKQNIWQLFVWGAKAEVSDTQVHSGLSDTILGGFLCSSYFIN